MFIEATPPPDEAARKAEEQALLKQDLMEVSAQLNTTITSESFISDFAESEKESKQLEAQLNSPVSPNEQVPAETCYIGSWLGNNILDGYTAKDFPQLQQQYMPGGQIIPQEVTARQFMQNISLEQANGETTALGTFSGKNNKIIMYTFDNKEFSQQKDYTSQYINKNPLAQYVVALHEAIHNIQAAKCGMSQIGHTATNASRFDDLCEQLTCASEFLTIAQKYTELKKQGVKNFQYTTTINGKESNVSMPLEDILDMYPGLRKAVTENGFSADNPESIKAVLQASANYWKAYRSPQYFIQNIENTQLADNIQKGMSLSTRVEAIQNEDAIYQEVADKMLKNVYISPTTAIDISPYQDILNIMPKSKAQDRAATASRVNGGHTPSDEEVLAINNYLEQKGITRPEDKDKYFDEQFRKIVNRAPDADKELKSLLLGNNGSIRYSDGLIETRVPNSNLTTISKENGNTYVVQAFIDFSQKRTQSHTNENSVSIQKNEKANNDQLSQQQISQIISKNHSR